MNELSINSLFDKIPELFAPLFEGSTYPWEILPKIAQYVKELTEGGLIGYTDIGGAVLVASDAKIYDGAHIFGPTVIGHGTEVRPGAFIRGNALIADGCVIGNSSEIKNAVIFEGAQIPHYNYVGDSILGNHSHLGAGAVCSNLKSDGKFVIIHADKNIETGLRKFGAILADGADIGCGSVLNPGTVIGKNTSVYPLTSLRGVYPSNSIVKSQKEIVKRI